MSEVSRVCEKHEVFGGIKETCHYELEELNADELFEQIALAIEDGMDYVPEEFEYVHIECLDEECYDTEEIIFNIKIKDYLSDSDIQKLEDMIKDEE